MRYATVRDHEGNLHTIEVPDAAQVGFTFSNRDEVIALGPPSPDPITIQELASAIASLLPADHPLALKVQAQVSSSEAAVAALSAAERA